MRGVVEIPAVEDRRLLQGRAQRVEIGAAELVPLGDDDEPVRPEEGVVAPLANLDGIPVQPHRLLAGHGIVGPDPGVARQ